MIFTKYEFSLDELLCSEVRNLEDFGSGDELLGNDACDGKHGKAAVVDLLGLHLLKLDLVSGLEAEGVELEVTVDV